MGTDKDVSKWIVWDATKDVVVGYFDNDQHDAAKTMSDKLNAQSWTTRVERISHGAGVFLTGVHVRVAFNKDKKDFVESAREARVAHDGQAGVVCKSSFGHGTCYEVKFFDDQTAWYDPDELELL